MSQRVHTIFKSTAGSSSESGDFDSNFAKIIIRIKGAAFNEKRSGEALNYYIWVWLYSFGGTVNSARQTDG